MKEEVMHILDGVCKAVPKDENTYIDEADGLLHCKSCGGARQVRAELFGEVKLFPCVCACMDEKYRASEEERKRKERTAVITQNKKQGFALPELEHCTFEEDDSKGSKLSEAMQRYCDRFAEFRKQGKGLILYGNVGTGKSYYAACIVNRLIENGYACLMTNFNRIVSQLNASFSGKDEYLEDLAQWDLICIDDLGVERDTEYMNENVNTIVDALYRAGMPMIFTSNLSPQVLSGDGDLKRSRVYSRLLERCFPILVDGEDRRKKKGREDYLSMKDELGL